MDTAISHAQRIKNTLQAHGHECVTPFDVCSDPGKSYGYYMGRDIEALLSDDVDGIVMGYGWHKSKGCRLELAAARIYGKHIVKQSGFHRLDLETLKQKTTNKLTMRKKYRIKTAFGPDYTRPVYIVQVRAWWGAWVYVKHFHDHDDPDFARREAEELLEKLNER